MARVHRPYIKLSSRSAVLVPSPQLRALDQSAIRPEQLPTRTSALLLRHFVAADAPAIMALNGEASTRRWLPSHVYATEEEAAAAIGFLISCYAAPGDPRLGPYVLAIEHADEGSLLGHVGFSPLDGEVEVSYAVAESARGRGYGAAALIRACDWVAGAHAVSSVVAITARENVPSRRTLERASFAHVRDDVMRFQGSTEEVSRYCRVAPAYHGDVAHGDRAPST